MAKASDRQPQSGFDKHSPRGIGRLLQVTCCCPQGVDLLAAWLAITVLMGSLVIAGYQLMAVSGDLGLNAFVRGGEIKSPTLTCTDLVDPRLRVQAGPNATDATDAEQQPLARRQLVHACWTPSQRAALPWLAGLDSLWALIYAPFLALLYWRLFSELAADRSVGRCRDAESADGPDAPARLWADNRWLALSQLAVGLLFVADIAENLLTVLVGRGENLAVGWLPWLLSAAFWTKTVLVVGTIAGLLIALGVWFIGLYLDEAPESAANRPRDPSSEPSRGAARPRLRVAVLGIIWRSRYSLAMLALFGFLALGMDQSRDVLVGMAQGLGPVQVVVFIVLFAALLIAGFRGTTPLRRRLIAVVLLGLGLAAIWISPLRAPLGMPLAMLLSVIAVWMFAYACWLWSRILSRLRPENQPDRQGAPADGSDLFAKWWARWLGLVPLLMLIALAGRATADATIAWLPRARQLAAETAAATPLGETAVGLFLLATFTAVLALVIQTGFMFDRARAQRAEPADGIAPEPPPAAGEPPIRERIIRYYRGQLRFLFGRSEPGDAPCADAPAAEQGYFNRVPPTREAIANELTRHYYRFPLQLPKAPVTLPLIALAGFELVRGLDLGLGGDAPLTLAAIGLALTLWTCVLGLLTQAAQQRSRPWVLVLLILVGVLAYLGLTDNHRVLTEPYPLPAAVGDAWPLIGMWLVQLALAALLALALFWNWQRLQVAGQPAWMGAWLDGLDTLLGRFFRRSPTPDRARGLLARALHAMLAVLGFVVGAVLAAIYLPISLLLTLLFRALPEALGKRDTRDADVEPPHPGWTRGVLADWAFLYALSAALVAPLLVGANWLLGPARDLDTAAEPRALDASIRDWVVGLNPSAETAVYFVAAEGGGIRAAYWSALVLERLARLDQHFADRTFSISGVSGGSIGAAAWYVCSGRASVALLDPELSEACVRRLGDANLLTPLLSGWLFEDVLASLLPTSVCTTPGCGVLSRGHLFERSLEVALPLTSLPLRTLNQAPPYLFLNSTRVEDGSRAIASPIAINPKDGAGAVPFPSSTDQMALLGDRLPLSTAAHNSARFTYVNAIGAAGAGRGLGFKEGYHLADGGYFDNSGGQTTSDIMRAVMRCLFDMRNPNPCGLTGEQRDRAARYLVPQAIHIRNGVSPSVSAGDGADACPPVPGTNWQDLDLYPDLLGPAATAFNAIGTGANGRVSESDVCRTVQAWRLLRAQAGGGATDLPRLRHFDLRNESVLYPLGWYLSPEARDGMERAACDAIPGEACEGSPGAAPGGGQE